MNKFIAIGMLIGLVAGIGLILLEPSLLDISYSFEKSSRQVQSLPEFGYRSGSVLSASLYAFPLLFAIAGGFIGWFCSKVFKIH